MNLIDREKSIFRKAKIEEIFSNSIGYNVNHIFPSLRPLIVH